MCSQLQAANDGQVWRSRQANLSPRKADGCSEFHQLFHLVTSPLHNLIASPSFLLLPPIVGFVSFSSIMFRSASNWQPPAPQVASLDPNESLSGWRDLRREGFIEPYRSANRHGGIHTKCNANKSPLFIVEFRELLGLCPLKHLPLHCPGAAFIGAKDSSRLPTPGASVAGSKRRDACFVFFDSQHDLVSVAFEPRTARLISSSASPSQSPNPLPYRSQYEELPSRW